jgi:hypothetical protein
MTRGGIIYDPDDIETLCENLRLLLRDKAKARAFGNEGRKNVSALLTHKTMAAGMHSVYRSLIH